MPRLPLQASADLQQELRRISIPTRLAKSSVLFTQGDRAKGVYLVESGSVALTLKLYRGGSNRSPPHSGQRLPTRLACSYERYCLQSHGNSFL